MTTPQEIAEKLKRGELLTEEEQKGIFSVLNADFEKLKKENPKKYLEYLNEINKVVEDLNRDLTAARQG